MTLHSTHRNWSDVSPDTVLSQIVGKWSAAVWGKQGHLEQMTQTKDMQPNHVSSHTPGVCWNHCELLHRLFQLPSADVGDANQGLRWNEGVGNRGEKDGGWEEEKEKRIIRRREGKWKGGEARAKGIE